MIVRMLGCRCETRSRKKQGAIHCLGALGYIVAPASTRDCGRARYRNRMRFPIRTPSGVTSRNTRDYAPLPESCIAAFASYSITFSADANNMSGTFILSAFAVTSGMTSTKSRQSGHCRCPKRADSVEKLENRGAPIIAQMYRIGDFCRCKALRIDTRASDRFCGSSCGPSPRRERDKPAVLRIFSHQRKRTFSTQSALFGHAGRADEVCS